MWANSYLYSKKVYNIFSTTLKKMKHFQVTLYQVCNWLT